MPKFVEVALLDQVVPGRAIVAPIGECAVVLFNVSGRVFAIERWCIRCGSSLSSAKLEGPRISCGGCDWQYDIVTGCVNGIPALKIDTFDVQVVDGHVMLDAALVPHSYPVPPGGPGIVKK